MLLISDEDCMRMSGPAMADLIQGLGGATPTSALTRIHGAARVDEVLRVLDRRGLLARNVRAGAPEDGVLGPRVIATGPAARDFAAVLASVARWCDPCARIVVTDSYLRPELAAAAAEAGPWLLVKVGSESVWAGPLFAAGRTPCWNCVRTRILARDDRLARLWYGGYRPLTLASAPAPFAREALVAAATEIERQLGRDAPAGEFARIARPGRVSMHPVVSLPTCAACANATAGGRRKTPPRERPADLWQAVRSRLGPLLDPVAGVVALRDVHRATSDNAVAVAVSTYANPSLDVAPGSLECDAAIAEFGFGAGACADDACARAVLEGVERYCTSRQGDEPHRWASLAELGDAAVHPNDLMCFDAGQLVGDGTDAPRRYTENIPLRWCAASTLTGVERWLPLAYCYRPPEDDPDTAYCVYDGNGSAVAFTLDDAIVSGFLEVVERDAVAIWWYNKLVRPTVDIESFGDDLFAEVAARQRASRSSLTVFDVTADLGVPTFVAMSLRHPGAAPRFGFGAHFDPRNALRCALLELGQAIRFDAQESRKWARFDWSGQSHLTVPLGPPRRAEHYRDVALAPTPRECAAAAAAAGTEIVVHDCTRADVGLPCVKVVVPGLRGIRPRFGPGRLFDVPVRMGWLARPRGRGELNREHLRS